MIGRGMVSACMVCACACACACACLRVHMCMPVPGPILFPVHWCVAVFFKDYTQHLLFVKQNKLRLFPVSFFLFLTISHGVKCTELAYRG